MSIHSNANPIAFLALLIVFAANSGSAMAQRGGQPKQHPNYRVTAGYLDVLQAISLLEKNAGKINEAARVKLLTEGRGLKRLEESYANGSQPSIKRYAAAEKKSEALALELKRLNALRQQIANNKKRTQKQVSTFNRWKDDYNVRAKSHNLVFERLVKFVNTENQKLEAKYVDFSSRVKALTNPPAEKISSTIQAMVADSKYQPDDDGTKCNLFIHDYASQAYGYRGFETKSEDGTPRYMSTMEIFSKLESEEAWKRIYDDPKWDPSKTKNLQSAFTTAARYANDRDLVLVGFKSNETSKNCHIAIVQKGKLSVGAANWNSAGIKGLTFPMVGQAGAKVFASKNLTEGISPDDFKQHGLAIYVLKL